MRYLGVDYGSRYIGLAIGDTDTHLAVPLETITHHELEGVADNIKKIIADEDVEGLVIGLPALGTPHTEQLEKTSEFIAWLAQVIPELPIETMDESFTSRHASELLREIGNSKDNHSTAAMLILQTYLDKIR